jgi:hypothetical protein
MKRNMLGLIMFLIICGIAPTSCKAQPGKVSVKLVEEEIEKYVVQQMNDAKDEDDDISSLKVKAKLKETTHSKGDNTAVINYEGKLIVFFQGSELETVLEATYILDDNGEESIIMFAEDISEDSQTIYITRDKPKKTAAKSSPVELSDEDVRRLFIAGYIEGAISDYINEELRNAYAEMGLVGVKLGNPIVQEKDTLSWNGVVTFDNGAGRFDIDIIAGYLADRAIIQWWYVDDDSDDVPTIYLDEIEQAILAAWD